MGCPVLMYRVGGTAIPAPYTVYNTTRVGVHMACICERKGVGTFTTRKRSYTIDCIYLYLIYVDIIRAPKWGPLLIGLVAQLDRVLDYGSSGCRFDSCQGHKYKYIQSMA